MDGKMIVDGFQTAIYLHLLCAQAVYLHAAEPFQNHWSVDLELQIWLSELV